MLPINIINGPQFDYIQKGNPTIDVNPSTLYATWLNTTTGELWICTEGSKGNNTWAGTSGRKIGGIYSLPFIGGHYTELMDYTNFSEIGCWYLEDIGSLSISNGKLWLEGNGSVDTYGDIYSTFSVLGDFVIDAVVHISGDTTSESLHYCNLRIHTESSGQASVGVCIGTSLPPVQQVDSTDIDWDKYNYDFNDVIMRLVRSSGVVKCLFSSDGGASWSAFGVESGKVLLNNDTSAAKIVIYQKREANAYASIWVDTITIVQAEGISWGAYL